MTIHEKLRKRNGTPEWIMEFAEAVCPESPERLLSTDERNILTTAAHKIRELEAERDKWKCRAEEAEQSPYSQTLRRADDHISDLHRERDDLRAKLAAAREALESLAVGYRRVTGLDGAHDPELRGAETTLAAIEGES